MKIAILKERKEGEKRVAASPETVQKMLALGAEVFIESNAGNQALLTDKAFQDAGAKIEKDPAKLLDTADLVLKVQPPFETISGATNELAAMHKGAVLVALLSPLDNPKQIEQIAKHQVTAFAMEMIPRISRAQAMDALSSQSNLAGYKAVLDAVSELNKVVPMMMTAAGTIKPANVLVLGAGVAGLQAIATAKRLGAVVSAFDVRPAVKEQVESLGATFIEVESPETKDAETKGGYAKEMSKEYQEKQQELIHNTMKTQDIVITTALIPGKPAPILITKNMVKDMKPGAVIADLAAPAGGNCEYTVRGKVIKQQHVTIIGYDNIPSRLPYDASLLYAKNVFNFIAPLINKDTGTLLIDMKDEIVTGTLVTHNGKVVHSMLSEAPVQKGETKRPAAKKPPRKVVERKPHIKRKTTPKAKKPAGE